MLPKHQEQPTNLVQHEPTCMCGFYSSNGNNSNYASCCVRHTAHCHAILALINLSRGRTCMDCTKSGGGLTGRDSRVCHMRLFDSFTGLGNQRGDFFVAAARICVVGRLSPKELQ